MANINKIEDLPDSLLLHDVIVQVCSKDIEEGLALTELEIQKLQAGETNPSDFTTWETSLKSVWYLYKALKCWISEANTPLAYENFCSARKGFTCVGHNELMELSAGLEVYAEGLLDVINLNINHGLQKIESVQDFFYRAGEFGSKYEKILDHMKQDSLSISAVSAIQNKDFNGAQVLFEEASKSSGIVSDKYYNPNDADYSFFKGMTYYYLGLYKCFWTLNELNNFSFDTVVLANDLDKEIIEACHWLEKCNPENKLQVRVYYIAQGITEILGVMIDLSNIMQNISKGSFQHPIEKFNLLQDKIQASKVFFSKAGSEAIALLTFSDEVALKIENIKRSTTPNATDFGKYSGIITCLIFLPTSLVLMWANKYFNVGQSPFVLVSISFAVSLVGGFGYGAIKFKDYILAIFKQK